tara:strand:- start:886 stop:1113 length:228 start_codon:yes stop_codon:yes gene_type:complete
MSVSEALICTTGNVAMNLDHISALVGTDLLLDNLHSKHGLPTLVLYAHMISGTIFTLHVTLKEQEELFDAWESSQ